MNIATLFTRKKAVFSIEVFPPKRDGSIDSIYKTLDNMGDLHPDFISVTYGAGGNPADNSTCEIACDIKHQYGIEPLAHLTCVNSTREQVLNTLDLLERAQVENVLALRGDLNPNIPPQTDFRYASELVRTVRARGGFNIVGACYPEGHCESESMEQDVAYLKEKVDAGVTHLVSQLFFDNADFYSFLYRIREAGITVPVQAGIMPVTNKKQVERMVSLCGASMPKKLAKMINRYENSPDALRDAGIAYATDQIIDLLSNSVQGVHLYTMNSPYVAKRISASVASIVSAVNG